jgi:hypothetical protein
MDIIVNPETGRRVSIYGKTGRRVLSNYIQHFGGSSELDPHERDMAESHDLDMAAADELDMEAADELDMEAADELDLCSQFTDMHECPDWCEISNSGAGEAYCRSRSPPQRAPHPTIMGFTRDPRRRGASKGQTQRKTKAAVGLMALASIPVVAAHRRQYTNGSTDGKTDAKTGIKDKERYQNDADYQKAYDKQKANDKEIDDK